MTLVERNERTPRSPEQMLRLVQAAVEQVSYAVLITTADIEPPGPRIVYVTPAFVRMTGYTADEILGKTPRILQGPNTDRRVLDRLKKELRAGNSHRCELINYRKNRSEYLVSLTVDPVRDVAGDITHWVAVQQDITERKRAEETLAHAERLAAIGTAMAGLSHESRNALQRAQGSLDELAECCADQPLALSHVANVRQAQDELFQLYEEVREFAAPVRLDLQTSYLENILHDSWNALALRREGRLIQFRELFADVDTQCEVDEFALRQVFRNILENALAACHDPVEISVAYSETQWHGRPAVQVSLSDNGPGLSAEQQRRIFDEFYTTKPHGTGLGMAIVKRLISAHGGNVTAQSALHAGAEIVIVLPRQQRPAR